MILQYGAILAAVGIIEAVLTLIVLNEITGTRFVSLLLRYAQLELALQARFPRRAIPTRSAWRRARPTSLPDSSVRVALLLHRSINANTCGC